MEVTFPARKPLAVMNDHGELPIFALCDPCVRDASGCGSLLGPLQGPLLGTVLPHASPWSLSGTHPVPAQGPGQAELFWQVRPPALCRVPLCDPGFRPLCICVCVTAPVSGCCVWGPPGPLAEGGAPCRGVCSRLPGSWHGHGDGPPDSSFGAWLRHVCGSPGVQQVVAGLR